MNKQTEGLTESLSLDDLRSLQIELEKESMALGVERFKRGQLPWQTTSHPQGDLSTTPGGQKIIHSALVPLAEGLDKWVSDCLEGRARRNASLAKYVEKIGTDRLAYVALRMFFGLVGSSRGDLLTLQTLADRVGEAAEQCVIHDALMEAHPRYYEKVLQDLTQHGGHRQRLLRSLVDRLSAEAELLDHQDRNKLGVVVVMALAEETGLVQLTNRRMGRQTRKIVALTEEAEAWLEQVNDRAARFYPLYLPMVAPPKPWESVFSGGYYITTAAPYVRTRDRNLLEDMESLDLSYCFRASNAVQSTEWRINPGILAVVKSLWEREQPVGKGLPKRSGEVVPERPSDADSHPELHEEWRRQAAQAHRRNHASLGKRCKAAQTLWIAEKFSKYDRIWFPVSHDFRGRMYYLPNLLNPQGDDLARGLLQFAQAKPLGEEGAFWLAVHLANCWGFDKASFQERWNWVIENEELILESALDPTGGLMRWTEADKPLQFLAACFEWMGYRLVGPEYESRLPIAMDGSCSGLQHYSAMLRDPVGATAVNLEPADRPNDIYARVAEKIQEQIEEDLQSEESSGVARMWRGKVDRSTTKRQTMTLAYGVTHQGMRDQTWAYLQEKEEAIFGGKLDNRVRRELSKYMGNAIWRNVREVVVAAGRAMGWLHEVSDVVTDYGIPLRWTTPAGFPVVQSYRKPLPCVRFETVYGTVKVKTHFLGKAGKKPPELSRSKQRQGVAPNFIHSLDATHLMMVSVRAEQLGIDSLSMIHDSFATHAADIGDFHYVIREQFVRMYTECDPLVDFYHEIRGQLPSEIGEKLPPPPPRSDLEIERVMDSWYFFA